MYNGYLNGERIHRSNLHYGKTLDEGSLHVHHIQLDVGLFLPSSKTSLRLPTPARLSSQTDRFRYLSHRRRGISCVVLKSNASGGSFVPKEEFRFLCDFDERSAALGISIIVPTRRFLYRILKSPYRLSCTTSFTYQVQQITHER